LERREFLQRLAVLMAAAPGLAGAPRSWGGLGPSVLPTRSFGSTGEKLPVLGLGGFHLGRVSDEKAARALVDAALEAGVRFFDTAEQYQRGDDSRSERWLGAALADVRDQVFVMTKTWDPDARSASTAREHLESSLERLQIETLDLWQLHAVSSPEDVDRAFAKGGAMEAILEAKQAGRVRFVGVTGHKDPAAHLRALHHWDAGMRFDAMQLPINPIDRHQVSFQLRVLPELVERGIAPIAMKTVAAGALPQQDVCTVTECLRYVLSLPVAMLVSGMESPEHVRQNAAALAAGPMDAEEAAALVDRIASRADLGLEWYKR
jgi:aryl-alcohol dehydrogenase-like predicted oxidoreductase